MYINFGFAKNSSTYVIELNGERKFSREISYTTLSSFMIKIVESIDDTYISELTAQTNYKEQSYFINVFNDNLKF